MQCRLALAELRQRLAAREACPVALIRNAEEDPPAVDLVVAYRLEDQLTFGRDGVDRMRLLVYDPLRGGDAASLGLTFAEDSIQTIKQPTAVDRPSVKALRLIRLDDADLPFAGWRCSLRPTRPRGCFWWLKRQGRLLATRKREAV
jgi:hypothetical protein